MNEIIDKPKYGRINTIIYAVLLGDLQMVARERGYALAVHGSLNRDFDIVAIPWTNEAIPAEDLVVEFTCAVKASSMSEPTQKPHGRVAWFITLDSGFGIDVSVMPRLQDIKKKEELSQ